MANAIVCSRLQTFSVTRWRVYWFNILPFGTRDISQNRQKFAKLMVPHSKWTFSKGPKLHNTAAKRWNFAKSGHTADVETNSLSRLPDKFKGARLVIKIAQAGKQNDPGREPWSSGYGWRLLFQRSWGRIPTLHTGLTFFHIYLL